MAVAGTQRQGQALHFLRHLGNKAIQPPQHLALRRAAQSVVIGVRRQHGFESIQQRDQSVDAFQL